MRHIFWRNQRRGESTNGALLDQQQNSAYPPPIDPDIPEKVDCPYGYEYLYGLWSEIKTSRERITWQELDAYCRLNDVRYQSWELNIIMSIDSVHWSMYG